MSVGGTVCSKDNSLHEIDAFSIHSHEDGIGVVDRKGSR